MTTVSGRGERLISLREAARMLGVHHATLARAVKRGDLKAAMTTPGGWKRFRVSDVEQLPHRVSRAKVIRSTMVPPLRSRLLQNEVERALSTMPEMARQSIGADFAAVTVLDTDGRVVQMYYSGLTEEQARGIGDPPRGIGVLGQLGQADSVLRLERITDHPRSTGFPPNHPPMESLLGISVAANGGLRANLYLANGPGRGGFTDGDESRLGALASFARLALENTLLLDREGRLRHDAEEAEKHLAEVIRVSAAGVMVFNTRERLLSFASSEARRITGLDLTPGTTRDRYLELVAYFTPGGAPVSRQDLPMERVMATGARIDALELIMERSDGRRIPVLVSGAPVFDGSGSMVSAVLVFQDTTRLKELDQVKSEFLSMITHDLRTPISTIKGVSSLLLDLAPDEGELRFHLEEMDDEIDYITELVGNLLDMTRIEAGSSRWEYEMSHMTDIVQDAVNRQARSRLGANRRFETSIPSELPQVYVDPLQIGRVLDNLLSNALKYSDGTIRVNSTYDVALGSLLTTVADDGDGIPADLAADIFDKFMRVRRGLRRGREGAGLGLAICKAIVEAHGGAIGVDSVEREGSNFWFTVPVAEKPESSAD